MKRNFTQLILVLILMVSGLASYGQNILIQVNSPSSVAGQITQFGVTVGGWSAPLPEDTQITSDIVLVNDGTATSDFGCAASPAGAYEGRIVFVRRGTCPFSDKVGFAEAAGAVAVIVVNNDQSGALLNMSAAEGVTVGIPVFMINYQTGEAILSELESGPVNMTLELLRPDDIGIAEVFSPMWFNSYATPQGLINYDTAWNFVARIFNVSKIDAEVEFSVTFNREDEEVIRLAETISMSARTDDFTYTPTFSIPSPGTLDPGTYTLVYSVQSDAFEDVNPQNNTRIIEFVITDGSYMQSTPEPNEISRICFESAPGAAVDCNIRKDYGHGAMFTFPPSEDIFALESVNLVIAGEDGPENLENNPEIFFFWLDVLSFPGMTTTSGATLGDGINNNYAGIGEVSVTPDDHEQEIEFNVTNLEETKLILENGKNYAGLITVPAGVLLGRSTEWINIPPTLDGFVYYWPNLFYYDGAFQSRVFVGGVYMKLNLELVSSVDDKPLPEYSVKMFPNPTQDYTMVELDLPKVMNATITLADISGRVLKTETYQNVQKHSQRLDIGSLSAGTYIVRVATPEGTSTKKLLVVR